jgi:hypothetical protein
MAAVGFVGLQVIVGIRDKSGDTPPTSMFIAAGLLVSIVALATVTLAARRSGIAMRAAIALGGAMAAIAFAKFALGPIAFARNLPTTEFQDPIGIGSSGAVVATAVVVGLLYVSVILLLGSWWRPASARAPRVSTGLAVLVCGVGALTAGAVFTGAPAAYVGFAVTGAGAAFLALLLFAGAALVAVSFANTAAQAKAMGTASVYLTVVWVAIAFVLVFQVLWVVLMIAVITIWPLRTVTPK